MLLAAGWVSHANRYHSSAPVVPDVSFGQEPTEDGRENSETSADLQAQQSMAGAAWAAVWVGVGGLIGLVFTVRYALLAWKSAEKSAKADNDALDLTRTQLNEARTAAEDQSRIAAEQIAAMKSSADAAWALADNTLQVNQKRARAYVHATKAAVKDWPYKNALAEDPSDFYVALTIENFGQTIAKKVTIVHCSAAGFRKDTNTPRAIEDPIFQMVSNLAPGQTQEFALHRRLQIRKQLRQIKEFNEADTQTFLSDQYHLHLWGEVQYLDIYGKRHRTAFQYVSLFGDIAERPLIAPTLDLPAFEEMPDENGE